MISLSKRVVGWAHVKIGISPDITGPLGHI